MLWPAKLKKRNQLRSAKLLSNDIHGGRVQLALINPNSRKGYNDTEELKMMILKLIIAYF